MQNEWAIKIWPRHNVLSIFHHGEFCSENLYDPDGSYSYGLAYQKVCYICKKLIPEHIWLQWILIKPSELS